MTENQIESEIVAAGANIAPRITPADVDGNIIHTEIVKHVSHSGQVLRWAVLTAKNGHAVHGEPSCSVSPANDDQEIGEKIAIENARRKMWPLMGYALKQKLEMQKEWFCASCCTTYPERPSVCMHSPDGANGCNSALARGC